MAQAGNDNKNGGNGMFDDGKQDHEARRDYSGRVLHKWEQKARRSFFVTEGGKLAKSLLFLKTFRRRFTPPKILFKYGGDERMGGCLPRQNTHEEEEEASIYLEYNLLNQEIFN